MLGEQLVQPAGVAEGVGGLVGEPSSLFLARELGARGSRRLVGNADPALELTPTAAAVVAAAASWWRAQASAAGMSGPWTDLRCALEARAPLALGDDADLVESWAAVTGEELGEAYTAALSPATRARHGRHYTPVRLAEQLWLMARAGLGHGAAPRRLPALVRDPACGAGALLLAPLREHLMASADVDPRVVLAGVPNVIEGIDTDPVAVWLANVVLGAELLPLLARVPERSRRPLPALARVGDGLAAMDQAPARVVVMNPPYGRVRLGEVERARFESVLFGHANLYGLFLGAALDGLDDRGVIAALVPTSFTSGRYFTRLRQQIAERAPLRQIGFVSHRSGVFASVLQETCLAVLSREPADVVQVTAITAAGLEDVAQVPARGDDHAWVLPRRAREAPIAAAAAAMPLTLSGAGWRASTGPLVWNRRRADLHPRAAADRCYVIWGADCEGGALHRDRARNTMRYLAVRGHSDEKVMVLDEPAVLVQRTTAPEQRRRLVAAVLDQNFLDQVPGRGGVVVENHVNVLRPTTCPALSQDLLGRLLATTTMDQLIRCISGSVALSAYELESLPLPAAHVLSQWERLYGAELEAAVAGAYGGREGEGSA